MYSLEGIYLIESKFDVNLSNGENKKDKSKYEIKTGYDHQDNTLKVYVGIDFESSEFTASISMVGIFKVEKEPQELPLQQFAEINAPAIIYPFIREHLANLTMKAGMKAVLLPPVNFVQLYEDRKKERGQ